MPVVILQFTLVSIIIPSMVKSHLQEVVEYLLFLKGMKHKNYSYLLLIEIVNLIKNQVLILIIQYVTSSDSLINLIIYFLDRTAQLP